MHKQLYSILHIIWNWLSIINDTKVKLDGYLNTLDVFDNVKLGGDDGLEFHIKSLHIGTDATRINFVNFDSQTKFHTGKVVELATAGMGGWG